MTVEELVEQAEEMIKLHGEGLQLGTAVRFEYDGKNVVRINEIRRI